MKCDSACNRNAGSTAAIILAIAILASSAFPVATGAAGWDAGVATAVITPQEPTWMAGYGSRDKPSEGVYHDLFVKALALRDPEGNRAVIVTADLIGIMLDFSNRVATEIEKRYGIPRGAILLNTSHTHWDQHTTYLPRLCLDAQELQSAVPFDWRM